MRFYLVFILLAETQFAFSDNGSDFVYHSYANLTSLLQGWAQKYPTKAYLYSIGKSVEDRDLWVMALADSQPNVHLTLRPEAKYVGNIHGDEGATQETLLHLINYMLTSQSVDPSVDYVMKHTRTHVLVSMNPDGFEKSFSTSQMDNCDNKVGHNNQNGFNLNRNFPDFFECNSFPIQPETQAVIDWLDSNHFILSIGFHTGSLVASYPYDNIDKISQSNYSLTMDNDVFVALALNYSLNHPKMKNAVCEGESFENGITNGGI
jgi:carboxypeptidase M